MPRLRLHLWGDMDLQAQVEIGRQAEEFLRYVEERPYFRNLIERIKLELAQQILSLPADEKETFSILKRRMDAVEEILYAVNGDVAIAREALKQIEGVKEQGIL